MNRNQFFEKLNSHTQVIVSQPDHFDPTLENTPTSAEPDSFQQVVAILTQLDGAKEAGSNADRRRARGDYRH